MATQFNISTYTYAYTISYSYTHCYTYAHSISYSRAQSDSHASPQAPASPEMGKIGVKSEGACCPNRFLRNSTQTPGDLINGTRYRMEVLMSLII